MAWRRVGLRKLCTARLLASSPWLADFRVLRIRQQRNTWMRQSSHDWLESKEQADVEIECDDKVVRGLLQRYNCALVSRSQRLVNEDAVKAMRKVKRNQLPDAAITLGTLLVSLYTPPASTWTIVCLCSLSFWPLPLSVVYQW